MITINHLQINKILALLHSIYDLKATAQINMQCN